MSEHPIRRSHSRASMIGKSAKDAEGSANADLHAVIAFSLVGLLLALYLVLRFPELGALVAQYNQF